MLDTFCFILLQLLGELYADKKYLEKLMDDQGTMGKIFKLIEC